MPASSSLGTGSVIGHKDETDVCCCGAADIERGVLLCLRHLVIVGCAGNLFICVQQLPCTGSDDRMSAADKAA